MFPVARVLVSSAAANVSKRPITPASSYKAVDSLGAPITPAAAGAAGSKFLEVYILGKHIGSGAYGQVQLVIERATGQCAAVKLLPKVRGKLSKVCPAGQNSYSTGKEISPC